MNIEALPYIKDITIFFNKLHKENYAILLDSGKPASSKGRYDIVTAWPECLTEITQQGITHIDSDKNHHSLNTINDLKKLLRQKQQKNTSFLPFSGGWIGFASYELCHIVEPHLAPTLPKSTLPLFYAGYYAWAIIQDHQKQTAFLIYEDAINPDTLQKIYALLQQPNSHNDSEFSLNKAFTCHTNLPLYQQQFNQVQAYLDAGDCYQVNLSMKFSSSYSGSPFTAYQKLRAAVPVDKMSYINIGSHQILSISPEAFISGNGKQIQTRPIKGTAARHNDPIIDQQSALTLQQSLKDRAENVMIVDLLRNDLGKFCTAGSVTTETLFAIESYANVHHLVSTINGTLLPNEDIWSVFFGAFPGGSITGAPKLRACEIIQELETELREIYCGSIFYASNNGIFDASITIRTLLCNNHTISAWAGGGIVKDSTMMAEHQECMDKIALLLQSLNP